MGLEKAIQRIAPPLLPVYRFFYPIYYRCYFGVVVRPRWRRMGMDVFTMHYREGRHWGCVDEFRSGDGSSLKQTEVIRKEFPRLVATYQLQSVLDIPCGDFNWMRTVDLNIPYTGADIVDDIVRGNERKYACGNRTFVKLDLTRDELPKVDLVLCRDCLFHFSYKDIYLALDRILRSGSIYLLTTTNTGVSQNRDIVTGEFRRLNLQIAPFCLPKPILLIDEKSPNPNTPDKHLALWRIADLERLAILARLLAVSSDGLVYSVEPRQTGHHSGNVFIVARDLP